MTVPRIITSTQLTEEFLYRVREIIKERKNLHTLNSKSGNAYFCQGKDTVFEAAAKQKECDIFISILEEEYSKLLKEVVG